MLKYYWVRQENKTRLKCPRPSGNQCYLRDGKFPYISCLFYTKERNLSFHRMRNLSCNLYIAYVFRFCRNPRGST